MSRNTRKLTHVGPRGEARMVDVSDKPVTVRSATARGRIAMSAAAVRLVRARGTFMQEAVPVGVGAMEVVLGLDDEKVEEACREAEQGTGVQRHGRDDLVEHVGPPRSIS